MRTALIAGASGLVGHALLRQLLALPEYDRIIAIGRRPLEDQHPKLVQVIADFAQLELVMADLVCTDAFCCLGTTLKQAGSPENFRAVDRGAVLAFAWAAQRHGARRFFHISALGANITSRFLYNQVKGETEEALEVLGFSTLGLFRPSLLLGERKEFRFGERLSAVLLWLADPLLLGPLRSYRAIPAEVVARAMVRCSLGQENRGCLIFDSAEIHDLGHFGP